MKRDQPPALSTATYRTTIGDLLANWDDADSAEIAAADVPIARLVYAFTAHAHVLADTALTLWNGEQWVQSAPIVRTCFEAAIYAGWAEQGGREAVQALEHEGLRQERNLIRSVEDAGIAVPAELSLLVRDWEDSASAPAFADQAKGFEKVCHSFQGTGLYTIYRFLCGMTHALGMAGRYMIPNDDPVRVRSLKSPPRLDESRKAMLAYVVSCSLIWSGRAVDEVCRHRPRKKFLQSAGRRLNVPPVLVATEARRRKS